MPNPATDTTLAMDIAVALPIAEDTTSADGMVRRDSSRRENEIRRRLCPHVMEEIKRRHIEHDAAGIRVTEKTERKESNLETMAQFMVDTVLHAVRLLDCQIYRTSLHCARCRGAIDAQYTEFLKTEPGRIARAERIMAEAKATRLEIENAEKAKKESEMGPKTTPKFVDPFARLATEEDSE